MVRQIVFGINNIKLQERKRMRLRHKKPIGSYTGYPINESNSVVDEIFDRQMPNSKKKNNQKFQEIKNKSKTLVHLIRSINQKYRELKRKKQKQILQKITLIDQPLQNNVENKPGNTISLNGKKKNYLLQEKIKSVNQNFVNLPPKTKKIQKPRHLIKQQIKRKQIKLLQSTQESAQNKPETFESSKKQQKIKNSQQPQPSPSPVEINNKIQLKEKQEKEDKKTIASPQINQTYQNQPKILPPNNQNQNQLQPPSFSMPVNNQQQYQMAFVYPNQHQMNPQFYNMNQGQNFINPMSMPMNPNMMAFYQQRNLIPFNRLPFINNNTNNFRTNNSFMYPTMMNYFHKN